MTTRLKQKVAIVTGAGSGIGCATAKLFAREGASVVIADIDPLGKATEDTIREHGGKDALFVPTDVKLEEDVTRMIETAVDRYGRIDILVNGAGLATPGDALKLSEDDWDSCMAVNLKGAWYCSKHAIRHMPKTGGSIVNIASTHPLRSQPNFFPYAVAKGGMLAMTGSLAIDFGPRGVRANSICPGFIDTPMNSSALSTLRDSPKQYQNFLALHPLRCLGRVEDVAYACLFLASDESRFITGTALIVDGGRTAFGRYFEDPALSAGDHSECNAK